MALEKIKRLSTVFEKPVPPQLPQQTQPQIIQPTIAPSILPQPTPAPRIAPQIPTEIQPATPQIRIRPTPDILFSSRTPPPQAPVIQLRQSPFPFSIISGMSSTLSAAETINADEQTLNTIVDAIIDNTGFREEIDSTGRGKKKYLKSILIW